MTTRIVPLSFLVCFVACEQPIVMSEGTGPGTTSDAGLSSSNPPPVQVSLPALPDAGAAPPGQAGGSRANCGTLTLVLRDFTDQHPDMEKYVGAGVTAGLVQPTLGPDRLPVYAAMGPTKQTAGKEPFDQWYRDAPGVNMRIEQSVKLEQVRPGVFVFDDEDFFPLDDLGFGNQGRPHNFHFTTEIHGTFTYRGGEKFTFRGDDDVFVFVNGRLALDLGGLHPAVVGTIDFDQQREALGIAVGGTYKLDVFHAERRTTTSHFRIETSIACLQTIE